MQDTNPLRPEHFKESSNIVIGKVEIDSDGTGDFQTIPDVTNFYLNTNIEDEVSRFCAYSFSVTFLNTDDKYFPWNTPSAYHNWLKQGRRVKIYGGLRVRDTFTSLSDPTDTPPTNAVNGIAFSHDSIYMATAHWTSPYITIYKRSGDTFTKLANPADLPPDIAWCVAFSHDSTYLAVGHYTSPYLTIYKRSGDTFTKLANPADLPASEVMGISFSYDSTYLAAAQWNNVACIIIYKRSGDTFTKLADPANLPSYADDVAFSHDSTYLAIAHLYSPYITIYKRSGDTFTKLSNPADLPTGRGQGVAFSHDSMYLTITHYTSPYLTIYKRSGDTFTKLANPADLPTNDTRKVSFSHDSTYLVITYSGLSPYIIIYKRSGDTFTKVIDPLNLPTGSAWGIAFSHDSAYLAIGYYLQSPRIIIYKVDSSYANYYHQWLTGRIDDWSLSTVAGQKMCTITGRDYMRVLLDYKLYSPNTYWGTMQTFNTVASQADYNMHATCKGVYNAYLDSINPYDGSHLTEIYQDLDWGYIETTNKFSFLTGAIPSYNGTNNLKVYYFQSKSVESVVGDILYYAGIFATTGERDTWLADTDYVTPTGQTIDRVWFNTGTRAMEAIRLLSEVVQYRFYFDFAGNAVFKPKTSVGTYVDTFADSDITQQETKEDMGEVYNHIIVIGEKRETLG